MEKLSTVKKNILLFLGTKGVKDVTNSQISSFLGKDDGNISKHLKDLRKIDLIVSKKQSEGRITSCFNNLTERGIEVLRSLSDDREIEQIVKNSRQVVNKLIPLSSGNKDDLGIINVRETHLPDRLTLSLDTTIIQVELFKKDIEFFWKLHKKISNVRIKGDYQDILLDILRRIDSFGPYD